MAAEVSGPALARRVRDTIAEHGLNDLVDAARELDVPEPELRAIVVEETTHPSLVVLASLIRRFDADACWLVTGEPGAAPSERTRRRRILR
jgi:hypothetical protein